MNERPGLFATWTDALTFLSLVIMSGLAIGAGAYVAVAWALEAIP